MRRKLWKPPRPTKTQRHRWRAERLSFVANNRRRAKADRIRIRALVAIMAMLRQELADARHSLRRHSSVKK